jgi:competence protein ComEC
MLVVPVVSILFYTAMTLPAAALLAALLPESLAGYIYFVPLNLLKLLIAFMTHTVRFFEQLPFALIENLKISAPDVVWLTAAIVLATLFLTRKRSKLLVAALCIVLLAGIWHVFKSFNNNELLIYHENKAPVIAWRTGKVLSTVDSIATNTVISLNGKKLLSVVSEEWRKKRAAANYPVHYLHLVQGDSISLYSLTQVFDVKSVIIDASLSSKNRRKFVKECEKLKIPYYDMYAKGVFRINF